MPRTAIQIRLDEGTHARLKHIAAREVRSLNAQMEYFILKGIEGFERDNSLSLCPHPDGSCSESPKR